jgi:glutathione S-transferase
MIKMQLLGSKTSPFVRKVRLVVEELSLEGEVEFIESAAKSPSDDLLNKAPIGKIPVLYLAENKTVFESDIISRFLAQFKKNNTLFPINFHLDFESNLALINGGIESAANTVMESWKEEAKQDQNLIVRYKSRIDRILRRLNDLCDREIKMLIANEGKYLEFALISLLGYLDFRRVIDNLGEYEKLVNFYEQVKAKPIFKKTIPE